MKVLSSEKKTNTEFEVKVEISAEEFNAAVNKSYVKNRGRITIPGWRKGKAPRKLIESMYGEAVFYDDAFDFLSNDVLETALEANKEMRFVGTPSISDFKVNDDKSAYMAIVFTLYPEVTLGEYTGIEAPKAEVTVTDEEVDKDVNAERERGARIVTVERPAQNGDTVTLSYAGTIDGAEFAGGTAESYDLELGSGSFIPGFEEQVVGACAGEEKDINVTFPEDYHSEEVAGKAAVFHIAVKTVSEKQLPELDDEFAKDVSEFDTYAEYRNSVYEDLKKNKESTADNEFRSALLEKIADNAQCEIPAVMVDNRVDNYVANYNNQLQASGLSMDMYMQFMGTTLDEFKKTMRASAEKSLKVDVVLEAIAEKEQLQPAEEDIEKEYQNLADQYSMAVEDVKKAIASEDIAADLKKKMAEDFVAARAVIVAPAEDKAEETPAEATEE